MVGTLVRRKRLALGMTQPELALKSGLRQTYISQVEKGEIAMPRDHNLDALGKSLGISRHEFYREAGYLSDTDGAGVPPPTAGDLPPAILALMHEMIRQHPELAAQLEANRDDDDFPAQVRGLAKVLGIVARGMMEEDES